MNQPMSDDDDHVTLAAEELADMLKMRRKASCYKSCTVRSWVCNYRDVRLTIRYLTKANVYASISLPFFLEEFMTSLNFIKK